MKLHSLIRTTLLLSALASPLLAQSERPNIVLLLVDDMGWSDLGCYGSELKTPNIDALAKDGVRFTQFYNGARCCPTRASLLTGLYAHQAGVGHMTEEHRDPAGKVYPGYAGHLNDSSVTLGEVLEQSGYFTAMTGKWHVGQNFGVKPDERGFERTLTSAAGGFYFPEGRNARLFYNGKDIGARGEPLPKEWYSSDLWSSFGLKFVDDAISQKKPFFLYTAFNAPHFPLQAPAEDIARWRGKFKVGWDKLREDRYHRQIAAGLIDPKWPLSPRPEEVPAWDSLTEEQKDRYDLLMSIYAAVIERMDKAVGELVDGLKQRGQYDNTLILFLSDNGGNAEAGVPGRSTGEHPGDPFSDVFIGQCWATLNNTPFTRYKHYTDEGGISTPLIAHWPKVISGDRRGALEKQPGHIIDILATFTDVAKADYPKEYHGHAITPLEGTSLVPAFTGQDIHRTQPLFWEHEGNRAVRDGDLKLVALENKPWRLYDLAADRSEQHDIAAERPEAVAALSAKWDGWAARANVLPLGAWRAGRGGNAANADGPVSSKTSFVLKKGDHLDRAEAPPIAKKGFTITADVEATGDDGVIVAQGGAARGYSLSINEGKLTFFVHEGSGTAQAVFLKPLPAGKKSTMLARLATDGTLSLSVDGEDEVTAKAQGAIAIVPLDGLDVGTDTAALVGPYKTAKVFKGEIPRVQIEVNLK